MRTPACLGAHYQLHCTCACREGRASHTHLSSQVTHLPVCSIYRTFIWFLRRRTLTFDARRLFSVRLRCEFYICTSKQHCNSRYLLAHRWMEDRRELYPAPSYSRYGLRGADRCHYGDEEHKSFYVNATFANVTDRQAACVSNNSSERYPASDVCVLTKRQGQSSLCTWDWSTGRFFKKPVAGVSKSERAELKSKSPFSSEILQNGSRTLVLNMCDS